VGVYATVKGRFEKPQGLLFLTTDLHGLNGFLLDTDLHPLLIRNRIKPLGAPKGGTSQGYASLISLRFAFCGKAFFPKYTSSKGHCLARDPSFAIATEGRMPSAFMF
jgi:hypothetical protein